MSGVPRPPAAPCECNLYYKAHCACGAVLDLARVRLGLPPLPAGVLPFPATHRPEIYAPGRKKR